MAGFVDHLLNGFPPWAVYLVVFLLPFLEASIFLGFVIPGETALVFGGVLANQGRSSLAVVLVLAIVGAFAGDTIGYEVGRHGGAALKASRAGRVVGEQRWQTTERFLHRHGAASVFFGRYTALLRALVPGAAGMARLPYRTFALWNLLGGATWATLCVVGGWLVGGVIGRYLADVGWVLVGLVVLALAVHVWHRRRHRPQT
jgi:membrane protein DedA with SNARE-associated domain